MRARSRSEPVISAAPVHQKDDVRGSRRATSACFRIWPGIYSGIVDHDAAGVDDFEAAAVVLGQPMDAVAGDAGLIADDGAPLSA